MKIANLANRIDSYTNVSICVVGGAEDVRAISEYMYERKFCCVSGGNRASSATGEDICGGRSLPRRIIGAKTLVDSLVAALEVIVI